ncbi:mannitol-1-phosphate 5-dehydrogenase [Xylariaceae sp. FL0804]|nr:mannitol-1-phosphate 5-dehydrogenase [Xylariaceae sp. FL0804]
MGKKAVHFGAGNIGRGFVACFHHESGYEVVFVDVVKEITDALKASSSYKVTELDVAGITEKTITNYRVINSKEDEPAVIDEIATADVVTCSVGPNILKFLAPVIAKGIDKRSPDQAPLAVIACENMVNATDALADHIKDPKNTPSARLSDFDERAVFANCAIDRIVPDQPRGSLDVKLEKFYEWVVESTPFDSKKIDKPSINGIKWVDNLAPFIERKLYTVNTSHATAAYFGYHKDANMEVSDAMADLAIRSKVEAAVKETGAYIVKKHGITQEEQDAYIKKILGRISNPHLADKVVRVGRNPMRKLGRKERFIGPAAALAEMDMKNDTLVEAAEMAFRFWNIPDDQETKELAKMMTEKSADDCVQQICGLETNHPLYPKIKEVVVKVQKSN